MADGLTDMGWAGTLWEESKMPLQNVTYHTPFVTNDLPLQLRVMNQLHETMPALSDAWVQQNQVFLGASGMETYQLLTREPIERIEDLDGMKILVAGSVANFLKGTGEVPVNSGLPDFYSNLRTGVADGVIISFSGAFPFKLFEPAPYITKIGIGCQMTGGLAVNRRKWLDLPAEVQKVMKTLGQEYSAMHAEILMGAADKFEGLMREKGATITTLAPTERKKWIDSFPDIAGQWRDDASTRNAAAGDVLKAYMDAMVAAGATPARMWG